MRAVIVEQPGGTEALKVRDLASPDPGAGEIRVKVSAAGVNFIDIYERTGAYPLVTPFIVGSEGAGRVSAVGHGVTGIAVNDRVAWAHVKGAGYAEQVILPAERAVPIPDASRTMRRRLCFCRGSQPTTSALRPFPSALTTPSSCMRPPVVSDSC